jgi:hypothetical protein
LLGALCGLFLWLTHDPLEAARRRIPLGGGEAAVIAAVGRQPDFVRQGEGPDAGVTFLQWRDDDDRDLLISMRDGRAVETCIVESCFRQPTLWERVRDWWPW